MCVSMFQAMVQALVEPQPLQDPQQPSAMVDEDKPPDFEAATQFGHVPLTEADPAAFFTDSAFFAKAPVKSSRKTCVRCGNSKAALFCFSCSRFYGAGGANFCHCCFEAYHPSYRMKHKWVQSEEIDQHVYRTSLERSVADIRGLLQTASNWGGELRNQDQDTKGDDAIKDVARLDEALSVKIRDLQDATCENEDRTKVETSAIASMELSARTFQRKYDAIEVADAEAGMGGGKTKPFSGALTYE